MYYRAVGGEISCVNRGCYFNKDDKCCSIDAFELFCLRTAELNLNSLEILTRAQEKYDQEKLNGI